jgi:CheY-like chemotaxis protein
VQLHGGTITAASDGAGCGATFTLVLPQCPSTLGPASAPVDHELARTAMSAGTPIETSNAGLRGLDILVVDDEADTLELFRQLLESAGATVRTAAGGHEALQAYERRQPDMLVTDLGLPGMDGYEVLRHVRAHPPEDGRFVPAVAVTAYTRMYDRGKSMAAGFSAHIAKPIDPTEFISVLIAAVNHPSPLVPAPLHR